MDLDSFSPIYDDEQPSEIKKTFKINSEFEDTMIKKARKYIKSQVQEAMETTRENQEIKLSNIKDLIKTHEMNNN